MGPWTQAQKKAIERLTIRYSLPSLSTKAFAEEVCLNCSLDIISSQPGLDED